MQGPPTRRARLLSGLRSLAALFLLALAAARTLQAQVPAERIDGSDLAGPQVSLSVLAGEPGLNAPTHATGAKHRRD